MSASSVSPGGPDVEAVSGDTIWYVTGQGGSIAPKSVVGYDIATRHAITWFDTKGSPYSTVAIVAVDPGGGGPVVLASNAQTNSSELVLLTQPDSVGGEEVIWSAPVQDHGFYNLPNPVIPQQGFLWFEVERYAPNQDPSASWPLLPGSTETLNWWSPSTGLHTVMTMSISGGAEGSWITAEGPCLAP